MAIITAYVVLNREIDMFRFQSYPTVGPSIICRRVEVDEKVGWECAYDIGLDEGEWYPREPMYRKVILRCRWALVE